MALAGTLLKRLPLTTAVLYLARASCWGRGARGSSGSTWSGAPRSSSGPREFAVIVSLFTAGLKLRLPLSERRWWLPVRLAFVSMALTVA